MKRNERNAEIQKEGFTELWDLAFKDNNKVTIADEGGIPIILSAMKTHSSNANVQYYGMVVGEIILGRKIPAWITYYIFSLMNQKEYGTRKNNSEFENNLHRQ